MPAGPGLGTAFPDVTCGHQVQMAASPVFVYRDFGWVATSRMARAQLIKVGEHVFFTDNASIHRDKQFTDLAHSGLA